MGGAQGPRVKEAVGDFGSRQSAVGKGGPTAGCRRPRNALLHRHDEQPRARLRDEQRGVDHQRAESDSRRTPALRKWR